MERMFQEFRDVAEFRIVYIREAHAVGSNRPSPPARDKNITEHQDFGERCKTAELLIQDNDLTIPCLIDSMDNKTDKAYTAKPDRAFLVDGNGRIAVAGARGPRGFVPALEDIEEWLSNFRNEKLGATK